MVPSPNGAKLKRQRQYQGGDMHECTAIAGTPSSVFYWQWRAEIFSLM